MIKIPSPFQIKLNDFYNQNLLASLTNVDMKDFTPYLEYFTAFPITAGNLTFRSQNVITNGDLSGINMLDTYKFAVGQKDKTMDAEYNLPLKLGLYVLTDSKEHLVYHHNGFQTDLQGFLQHKSGLRHGALESIDQ